MTWLPGSSQRDCKSLQLLTRLLDHTDATAGPGGSILCFGLELMSYMGEFTNHEEAIREVTHQVRICVSRSLAEIIDEGAVATLYCGKDWAGFIGQPSDRGVV